MMLRIAFNPADLKTTDEAWPAFQAGGITLKVWGLYKKHFITSQHFVECLERLADRFEKMFDEDEADAKPYTNIDEFMGLLGFCGFHGGVCGPRHAQMKEWALKYWDYFNLNIQKSLWIEYQSVETVTKQVLVGVHCNQPAAE